MTKLKCQMNVRIQMANKGQSANAKAQMSNEAQNPNGKSKARAWTSSNDKIQRTIEIQMLKCQNYLEIGVSDLAAGLPRFARNDKGKGLVS